MLLSWGIYSQDEDNWEFRVAKEVMKDFIEMTYEGPEPVSNILLRLEEGLNDE